MILVDSSAWIDYLRGLPTAASAGIDQLARRPEELATTEPVMMELLAGTTSAHAVTAVERLLAGLALLGVDPAADYAAAADLFRAGRRGGVTVRRLSDCLIAAVAIRHDATVAHKDVDFDVIAQFTPLRVLSWR